MVNKVNPVAKEKSFSVVCGEYQLCYAACGMGSHVGPVAPAFSGASRRQTASFLYRLKHMADSVVLATWSGSRLPFHLDTSSSLLDTRDSQLSVASGISCVR